MDEGDWQVGDVAVGGLPLEEDFARIEGVNAREGLDQGGFAGSVLAEKREHLTLADVETDILQRVGAAELLVNGPQAKKGVSVGCAGRSDRFVRAACSRAIAITVGG
jgi:hypothetical protein